MNKTLKYKPFRGGVIITDIGDNLMTGNLVIPDRIDGKLVTAIGEWAFSHCYKLTSVTVPNSVKSIGDYAFDGCTALVSITIPAGLQKIGIDAFPDSTKTKIIRK